MKQINFLLIIAITMLVGCGGSKTKHTAVETGRSTLAEEEFATYLVDNEYLISTPSFLKLKKTDPDRFSFECNEIDIEDLDNIGFWGVSVEGDTRETYEARRNKEGNLDKYPFTLKGYYNVGIDKADKSKPLEFTGPVEEININNMPALAQSYKATVDLKIVKAHLHGFIAYIQAGNGKIYRINVSYPPEEGDAENIPEWVVEVCNSFMVK